VGQPWLPHHYSPPAAMAACGKLLGWTSRADWPTKRRGFRDVRIPPTGRRASVKIRRWPRRYRCPRRLSPEARRNAPSGCPNRGLGRGPNHPRRAVLAASKVAKGRSIAISSRPACRQTGHRALRRFDEGNTLPVIMPVTRAKLRCGILCTPSIASTNSLSCARSVAGTCSTWSFAVSKFARRFLAGWLTPISAAE